MAISRVPSGEPSSTMMISQFRLLLVEIVSCILGMVGTLERSVLFSECSFKQPADNREVPPLVVGREND